MKILLFSSLMALGLIVFTGCTHSGDVTPTKCSAKKCDSSKKCDASKKEAKAKKCSTGKCSTGY